MSHDPAAPDTPVVTAVDPPGTAGRRRAVLLILKTLLLIGLVLGGVVAASVYYRPQLEPLARGFIARFGLLGLVVGSLLADSVHVPVPPQFYILTVVASGGRQALPMAAIILGSVLGGLVGHLLGRAIASRESLRLRFARSQEKAAALFTRHGLATVLLLGVSPMPYPLLCQAAGFYRMSPRLFALYAVLRVPRLLFFYALIRLGWR